MEIINSNKDYGVNVVYGTISDYMKVINQEAFTDSYDGDFMPLASKAVLLLVSASCRIFEVVVSSRGVSQRWLSVVLGPHSASPRATPRSHLNDALTLSPSTR